MLKHQFFVDFQAVPLSSFYSIGEQLSRPKPHRKVAAAKVSVSRRRRALPLRKRA